MISLPAAWLLFYIVPAMILQTPQVQEKITVKVSSVLSKQLNVPVEVGNVSFEWLNRLVIKDIYLSDEQHDTLFLADHVSAGFEILPFLRGKWVFTEVRLIGFIVNLNKASRDSTLNIQFVIDALASRDTTKQSNIDLKIRSIQMKRGHVKYHVADEPEMSHRFDMQHIDVGNLSGQIRLNVLTKDSINMQVSRINLEEHSGFKLDKLTFDLTGNTDSMAIRNLVVMLPSTSLRIESASVRYNALENMSLYISKMPMQLHILPSQICLKDIAAFVPALDNFTSMVNLSAKASGYVNNFVLNDLKLELNHSASVSGRISLTDIMDYDNAYLFGKIDNAAVNIEEIMHIINHFRERPLQVSKPITRLGKLNFSGEISGFFNRLTASGDLHSDIGMLNMDLFISVLPKTDQPFMLKGKITSDELKINKLFDAGNPYGIIRFQTDVDLSRKYNNVYAGMINAQINSVDYKGYRYENILLSGSFDSNQYDGSLDVNDPNGKLHVDGLFKYDGENSVCDFIADVKDVKLSALHITEKYENPILSLKLAANFTGNHIDLFRGKISVDQFSFVTKTDRFLLDSLRVDANGSGNELILTSDLLNGEIRGAYSFQTLLPSLLHTGKVYLPALAHIAPPEKESHQNAFAFFLEIENTESLSSTFKLPIRILEKSYISGQYNNESNRFQLDISLPDFVIGKSIFKNGSLQFMTLDDKLKLDMKTTLIDKNQLHNHLSILSESVDNQIKTSVSLIGDENNELDVRFLTSMQIAPYTESNGKKSLQTDVLFLPNQMLVKNAIWNLAPSSVTFVNGHTSVHNFNISNGDQFLHIQGSLSAKQPKDELKIDLNKIELSHIFDIIDIPALQFGGQATGSISLSNLYEVPNIKTELEVQDFSFNQVIQGKLNIFSQWDNGENGILLLGTIYKNNDIWTDVSGYIYPDSKIENISLFFDAKDIDMRLLHPYVQGFTHTIEGNGSGNIHLFGTFSDITFEGKAFVREGLIGVDMLNTQYSFNDSVEIRSDAIIGENITLYDRNGNMGSMNFEVNHQFLRDFTLNADIQSNNMLLYDVSERVNPQIYGTVYGSGNARISLVNQLVNIDANIRNSANSFMGFNFMNGSSAENYDFVLFKDVKTASNMPIHVTSVRQNDDDEDDTKLRINCFIDVLPTGNLELVMDPVSGDKIKGNGSGNIQVQYDSDNDLAMFGGFTVQNGSYNFSLQQVLHKDFKIREGSRIDFSGNPLDAILTFNALYALTASIEDLDQSLVKETLRTSVPVNCILNLNGRMQNPTITFDLEFPNSTNELQRQVKSFISTEDMMVRQIVYLLVLNKFYTPDYSRNDYRANEFSAVASSALSAQLSNILNSLTDKVQIGTNIRSRQDGVSDTEVEMLLSSQLLDNRLLINGNFGYKNNFIQTNAFIGEFDLEYKLTPSGELRLKAYNHANDMYRYNMKSLTRQGVGLMYYKDFDIFKRRKSAALEIGKMPADEGKR